MNGAGTATALLAVALAALGNYAKGDFTIRNSATGKSGTAGVPDTRGPATLAVQRRIALTFDDLPAVSTLRDLETWKEITEGLLRSLGRNEIQAIGFVNESKLYVDGEVDSARVWLLRAWLLAGHELGNHSHSHRSLYRTPLAEFEQDVLRGEELTRPLSEQYGSELRYFRHPMLNTGPDLETKEAFEDFLERHGYRVAPVSMDNQEWIFARAYDNALDASDDAAAGRVVQAYLPYMDSIFGYYEQQSTALLGYELPQVLLLHANRLNAHTLDELVGLLRSRSYEFTTLEDALEDPAYSRSDGYAGTAGITWLHRWALTEGKRGDFFAGEPDVPEFVTDLSGLGGG
jgi:peptidoglycan/xylan/chitin deacetylase (PgdA/CDA1 family)